MRDESERKMLEEVALRNAIAKFRDKSKKKAIPRVGIFWIDYSGTMFAESISLRDAVDYGDCRVFDGSHYDLWSKAVSANPEWRGKEYEEVPRGRVAYRRDPKKPVFIVYLPRQLVKYKNRVMSAFELPSDFVRLDTTDEHYRILPRGTHTERDNGSMGGS